MALPVHSSIYMKPGTHFTPGWREAQRERREAQSIVTVQVSILPKDVISNEPVSTVLGSNPGPWDYNPNTLTTEPPRPILDDSAFVTISD